LVIKTLDLVPDLLEMLDPDRDLNESGSATLVTRKSMILAFSNYLLAKLYIFVVKNAVRLPVVKVIITLHIMIARNRNILTSSET
jgi:hypothetical protein